MVVTPSPVGDISILKKGESVLLKSTKYQKLHQVEYSKEISGACVVKFTNVNTINEALALLGYSLFSSSNAEGKTMEMDLIGFTVTDIRGHRWGEIINVETSSLNKILEIQGADDMFYVPFDEAIVKDIKKKDRVVIIDPPDGLMEINK